MQLSIFPRILGFAFCATLVCGCGGGGGGGGGGSVGGAAPADGSLTIALTDSASDELETFEVDVSGISLQRVGGSTVSVLGRATRVDLTDLDSLSELIVGGGIDPGAYAGLTMTLDFSNAVVTISGQTTPATVVDENGNPITGPIPVRVNFAEDERPHIVINRRHFFELDLNLDESVTVDAANNRVTFVPVMTASPDPDNPKPTSIQGILAAVNTATGTFTVDRRAEDQHSVGMFTVSTSATTMFQVDGTVFTGAAGLAGLATMAGGTTQVWAQGSRGQGAGMLDAVAVEAGAGTRGNGQDWVIGHIVGRDLSAGSDATLRVLGRSLNASDGSRQFHTTFTVGVQLGTTRVLRRGAGDSLTTDALDVGQQVAAFGTLTGAHLDSTGAGGRPGIARMLLTSVFGTASATPADDVLTMDVARFDQLDIGNFDFNVGGVVEADSAHYTVNVAGLDTGVITADSRVRCTGWIDPVGVASDQDFKAISLVDRTIEGKLLTCQWVPPSTTALPSVTATALTLDVSNATVSTVDDGFESKAILPAPPPTLVPLRDVGFFLIVQNGALDMHLHFSPFATALQSRMSAGAAVSRIFAGGRYDTNTQVFSAVFATVFLD